MRYMLFICMFVHSTLTRPLQSIEEALQEQNYREVSTNECLSLGETAKVHIILMIIVSVNRELLYTYMYTYIANKNEKCKKKT